MKTQCQWVTQNTDVKVMYCKFLWFVNEQWVPGRSSMSWNVLFLYANGKKLKCGTDWMNVYKLSKTTVLFDCFYSVLLFECKIYDHWNQWCPADCRSRCDRWFFCGCHSWRCCPFPEIPFGQHIVFLPYVFTMHMSDSICKIRRCYHILDWFHSACSKIFS